MMTWKQVGHDGMNLDLLKLVIQGTRTGVPLTYVYYHGTYRAKI